MAKRPDTTPIRLSVLDRLIDYEPKTPIDPPVIRAQVLRELKAIVRRDMEWLLNTRRTPEVAPDGLHETQKSLYHYGMPDICSVPLVTVKDQQNMAALMETVISIFEPRLASVRVSINQESPHALHFTIEGLLRIDPAPEPITFDTVLEVSKGQYAVKGETGAG